ncbi:MAG: histidine--tRNA ligase [Chitinophagales bacterium]
MSEIKKIKPSLSKGTRDFLPSEVAKRNYIFDTIKSVFRKYGFEQIETPAIERLETLTGKYGEEGDKLLFKILNSGDYLKDVPTEELSKGNSQSITKFIAEKGLRYDLTVPLARYVVQHQDDLAFPFKRFHIGPVWRADRPQKGRYQELYQCDVDVIGSSSLLNEVELTKIYAEGYEKLGLNVSLRMNNRKILEALAEYAGCKELLTEITVAIDKLDKIGIEGVKTELSNLNISAEQQGKIVSLLLIKSLEELNSIFENIEIGRKGIEELNFVFKNASLKNVVFDITLARGLNYYTGVIWEVEFSQSTIGSLGGGGRYDNLTEMFGGQNMSGVGISFGIERIYDVMEELNLFPETISRGVKALFVPREKSVEEFTFQQVQKLRDSGIAAEIFLGNVKKQKQFSYVEQKKIPFLIEVGSNEMTSGLFRVRNTATRETGADMTLQDVLCYLQ